MTIPVPHDSGIRQGGRRQSMPGFYHWTRTLHWVKFYGRERVGVHQAPARQGDMTFVNYRGCHLGEMPCYQENPYIFQYRVRNYSLNPQE